MLTVIFLGSFSTILYVHILPKEKDFPVQTDNNKNLLRANIAFQGRRHCVEFYFQTTCTVAAAAL